MILFVLGPLPRRGFVFIAYLYLLHFPGDRNNCFPFARSGEGRRKITGKEDVRVIQQCFIKETPCQVADARPFRIPGKKQADMGSGLST